MHETQRTISDWAVKTFGNSKSVEIVIKRMLKECYELQELLDSKKWTEEQLADELADIFICGYRAFDALGFKANACIDHKMQINRARKWKMNGDGTGQHIKE